MKRCPKCGGKEFYVNAHVVEEWLVDENGDFVCVASSCVDVAHEPDDKDIWECVDCGYDDVGHIFNVEENK